MQPYSQGQSSIGYSLSHLSGTMAAGLGSDAEIFQLRNSGTRRMVVHSVSLDGLAGSATAFAAGFAKVALFVARAWTADGSGGTDRTPATDSNQLRTADAISLATARGSATAALTAGTKTIDAVAPVGLWSFSTGTAASVIYVPQKTYLFRAADANAPIILDAQEGLVVLATVPATGTWQFGVTAQWQETN
jgi:hypothetical protein